MVCDPNRIISECKRNDMCGQAQYVNIDVTPPARLILTRARAKREGQALSVDAVVGDFIACEVADNTYVPFMVGFVTKPVHDYHGDVEAKGESDLSQGDSVLELQAWMPLENGGGSATYQCKNSSICVNVDDVRFRCTREEADKQHFKLTRSVTPECTRHHKLVLATTCQLQHECDICNATGTTWTCSRRLCDYDLCSSCKDVVADRRLLAPATKTLIYNAIPNVEQDPFEDQDGGDEWSGLYRTTSSGVLIKDVALHCKVSLAALLDHNGGNGLAPDSRLRRGTELWIPGQRGLRLAGPE